MHPVARELVLVDHDDEPARGARRHAVVQHEEHGAPGVAVIVVAGAEARARAEECRGERERGLQAAFSLAPASSTPRRRHGTPQSRRVRPRLAAVHEQRGVVARHRLGAPFPRAASAVAARIASSASHAEPRAARVVVAVAAAAASSRRASQSAGAPRARPTRG